MKKRQRLKRARVSLVAATDAPYDRRSTDLLLNARVAPVVVDDPFEHGAKVTVLRSLRHDPLAALHDARQIDYCQYLTGRHWQRAFELAQGTGVRAIDTTKEAVDGGAIPQATVTDAQIIAFGDLAKAITALGMEGESIVKDILGEHLTIAQTAAKRGLTTEQERKYIGRRFRETLDTMALVFGYANSDLSKDTA